MNNLSFTARRPSTNDNQATTQALSDQDFVILCLPSADEKEFSDAVHALYFLPKNYKLTVLAGEGQSVKTFGDSALMDRIHIETGSELPQEASFSQVDAIIYSESTPNAGIFTTPRVRISKDAVKSLQSTDTNDYTISADNPEALASAMLRIARAVHA